MVATKTGGEPIAESAPHAMFELLTCFSNAQADFPPLITDASNPAFRSRYATLEAVQAAVFPALRKHGLVALQDAYTTIDDQGRVVVTGTLALWHIDSGQHIDSILTMIPAANTPQAIGSCVTYLRRYILMTTLGLAAVDDDGNAAAQRPSTRVQTAAKPEVQENKPDAPPTVKPKSANMPFEQWTEFAHARDWAVKNGFARGDEDARAVLTKVVEENGGRLTKGNRLQIFEAFRSECAGGDEEDADFY